MDRLRQGWMVWQRLLLAVPLNDCLSNTLIIIYCVFKFDIYPLYDILDRITPYDFTTLLFPPRNIGGQDLHSGINMGNAHCDFSLRLNWTLIHSDGVRLIIALDHRLYGLALSSQIPLFVF